MNRMVAWVQNGGKYIDCYPRDGMVGRELWLLSTRRDDMLEVCSPGRDHKSKSEFHFQLNMHHHKSGHFCSINASHGSDTFIPSLYSDTCTLAF